MVKERDGKTEGWDGKGRGEELKTKTDVTN